MERVKELIKNENIIVIGVTGGVGCGKSTVLSFLEEKYKASIYKADEIGHMVMNKGTDAYKSIIKYFGTDVTDEDGNIDRKKLGNIVFNDIQKLEFLNSVIHPAVENSIINGIYEEYNNKHQKLFFIEAALLLEAGYKSFCTEIWYIHADKSTRIARLMESRQYTKDKCIDIMNNQLSEDDFRQNCDFVLDNENDFNITKNQIAKHMKICYNYSID